jgi:multidrug resistance efflux pump
MEKKNLIMDDIYNWRLIMNNMRKVIYLIILLTFTLTIVGCDGFTADTDDPLEASGIVEVVEVLVASEIGGKVVEVFVSEGDQVQVEDPLFRIKNEILEAQLVQAQAALSAEKANLRTARAMSLSAEAALDAAKSSLELANIQYEVELMAARLQEQPSRTNAWDQSVPNEFDLPVWYFSKTEETTAAQAEVKAAWDALQIERENLEDVLDSVSNADLREAEERLVEAQAAFLVAEELLDRDVARNGREEINDFVQSLYDSAEAELESAQKAYDNLLSDKDVEDLLEARGRVAVSQERYEIALDNLYQLFSGEDALQVRAAQAVIGQAKAMVAQSVAALAQTKAGAQGAEKVVSQAKAAVDLFEIQIDQLTVRAATDGVVLIRNVELGEVVQPGMTVMTIGQLDNLTITVYIPEDRYGDINLGDTARVSVDSFPDEVFDAVVTRIADQAEYTPRNVQTEEDRKTTVFAIQLSVVDGHGQLKPGMPADVIFDE